MDEQFNNDQQPQQPEQPQQSYEQPQQPQQPYQPPYQQQPYQPQPIQSTSNGMSVAALVCGILGIIGGFIPVVQYFTLVLAIIGIVFGVQGKKKAALTGTGSGLATAGLVLGIIGASLNALGILCVVACVGSLGSLAALS
ncbi:MAG: DUF4190 domain-containing protein [Oscillospiraceae bacterium]|nr:DUF4190 domain-containing protein [Oscillospiraceae bacterium]MDD4414723.1 DUF4190 domain-containing protein [Oscillospiraceae bacterium]